MKSFFLVLAVIGLVLAKEDFQRKSPEEIRSIADKCLEQYPVPQDLLARMWALDLPHTNKVHKHMACVVKDIGIYVPNKGYDLDRLVSQFNVDSNDSELMDYLKNCIKHEGAKDEGDDVYDGLTCILDSKIREPFEAEIESVIPDNIKEIINQS